MIKIQVDVSGFALSDFLDEATHLAYKLGDGVRVCFTRHGKGYECWYVQQSLEESKEYGTTGYRAMVVAPEKSEVYKKHSQFGWGKWMAL